MKKGLAICLCIAMLAACFTACDLGTEPTEPREFTLEGTWVGTVDLMALMSAGAVESGVNFGDYYDGSMEVEVIYTFQPDGIYTVTFPEDTYENLKDELQILAGNMMEKLLAQQGIYIDIQQYLASTGMSWDALQEEFGLSQKLFASLGVTGRYKLEDGRLYTTTGTEEDFAPEYAEITVLNADAFRYSQAVEGYTMTVTFYRQ